MSRNGDLHDAAGEAPRQRRPRQHRPRRCRPLAWRAAGWLAAFLVLLPVVVSLGAYVRYRSVWDSIRRIDVTGLGHRPPKYNNALNVLLIGSDSRAGQNRRFGAGIQGQRSDTIMLLHISPDHHHMTVVSIPRDTVVASLVNQTFAIGGPGCLWKTVEQETGVHIDHFVELTFTGFEHVINDIGGVRICLPTAINDPDSGLSLAAGVHHVTDAQALAFWRERHIGLGSDLQRIQRDQYLVASMVRSVARADILGSPARLYAVLIDAARAMTTDAALTPGTMLTIGESLHSLSSKSVQFVTVPEVPYPRDPQAETKFAQPQASALFTAIARDHALPERARPATRLASRPGARAHRRPPAPGIAPVGKLARTLGGITGSAPACGDQAAFAGGDVPADFPGP